jgi:DNA-binding NarL/FixJ family response regulator
MDAPVELSGRELEVVTLLVEGLSNQQIADRLVVSGRTVHSHIAAAARKSGTRTRVQLAVYALRNGIVPLEPPQGAPEQ